MSTDETAVTKATVDSIREELLDSYDEEFELEMDEALLERQTRNTSDDPMGGPGLDRKFYFRELFRLQTELVKLQDWVSHEKLKVVVLFEGRDSAGKGGVIKRITQRLNPRVCRVVALPAPTEARADSSGISNATCHTCRPPAKSFSSIAAGITAPASNASWASAPTRKCKSFFRSVPEFERMLVRSGILLIKYWFSITR